jgi:hypothetical protein
METTEPSTVTIQLEKINPFKTITIKTVDLTIKAEEKTAFRFTVSPNGEVIDLNELPKQIAHARPPGL